jgi:hypothetical protein
MQAASVLALVVIRSGASAAVGMLAIVGAAIATFFGIAVGGWIGCLISGFIGPCFLIRVVRAIRAAWCEDAHSLNRSPIVATGGAMPRPANWRRSRKRRLHIA